MQRGLDAGEQVALDDGGPVRGIGEGDPQGGRVLDGLLEPVGGGHLDGLRLHNRQEMVAGPTQNVVAALDLTSTRGAARHSDPAICELELPADVLRRPPRPSERGVDEGCSGVRLGVAHRLNLMRVYFVFGAAHGRHARTCRRAASPRPLAATRAEHAEGVPRLRHRDAALDRNLDAAPIGSGAPRLAHHGPGTIELAAWDESCEGGRVNPLEWAVPLPDLREILAADQVPGRPVEAVEGERVPREREQPALDAGYRLHDVPGELRKPERLPIGVAEHESIQRIQSRDPCERVQPASEGVEHGRLADQPKLAREEHEPSDELVPLGLHRGSFGRRIHHPGDDWVIRTEGELRDDPQHRRPVPARSLDALFLGDLASLVRDVVSALPWRRRHHPPRLDLDESPVQRGGTMVQRLLPLAIGVPGVDALPVGVVGSPDLVGDGNGGGDAGLLDHARQHHVRGRLRDHRAFAEVELLRQFGDERGVARELLPLTPAVTVTLEHEGCVRDERLGADLDALLEQLRQCRAVGRREEDPLLVGVQGADLDADAGHGGKVAPAREDCGSGLAMRTSLACTAAGIARLPQRCARHPVSKPPLAATAGWGREVGRSTW